jgi:CBS domain-containing protein
MNRTTKPNTPLGMQIREIMTRDVVTIHPEASLTEAAQRMNERDVGMLPVCEDNQVIGIVTDRDITIRAIAEGLDPNETQVREIMTPEVVYCIETEDVQDAVESMENRQIRRIVVLTHTQHLVGVLSIGDVAVDTGNQQLAGEVLQKVSEPEKVVH